MYGKAKYREEHHGKTHVKKGDTVVILSGKDGGKQGKVLRVLTRKGTAIVERANFQKKHTKANPQKNIKGGILERESPIRTDKLQVVCPHCNEPARLGTHRSDEGSVRFCRKCNSDLGK